MASTNNIGTFKKKLISGGFWALTGKIIAAVVSIATNAILARILTPMEFGAFFLIFSIVMMFNSFGNLGLKQLVVKYIAEYVSLKLYENAVKITTKILIITIISALFSGLLFNILSGFIASAIFNSQLLEQLSIIISFWIVLQIIQQILSETFRGFYEIHQATLLDRLLSGFIFLIILITLNLFTDINLSIVLIATVTSVGLSLIYGSLILKNKFYKLSNFHTSHKKEEINNIPRAQSLIKLSLPLMITNLTLYALSQADLWIVGVFGDKEDVAIYGATVKLVTLVAMPLTIVNAITPPLISSMYAKGDLIELQSILRKVATISGIPAFLILISFITLGKPILSIVFGDFYANGAVILLLLSIGHLFNVWSGSSGLVLMMTGNQKIMMNITVISSFITIGLGIVLMLLIGTTGAAIATTSGLIIQNISMLIYAKLKVGIWTHIQAEIKISDIRRLIKSV